MKVVHIYRDNEVMLRKALRERIIRDFNKRLDRIEKQNRLKEQEKNNKF